MIRLLLLSVVASLVAPYASSSGRAADSPTTRAPAPLHGTLVAANMNDNTATILDLATGRTVATLPTGTAPHEVAISHDGRWAVVSNYGIRGQAGHSLTVIDLQQSVPIVSRTIDLGEYQQPHGSVFLPGDTALLVTAQVNKAVLVVNLVRGAIDTAIPTNQQTSHMIALTANGRRAYTTNVRDGTISELDIAHDAFVRAIPVARAVEGIAVSPSGDQVWVASNQAKTVNIVSPASGTVTDTIGGFGMPYRMAITSDGRTAIITDPPGAEVRFMNVATRQELGRVTFAADSLVPTAEFPGSPCPEGVIVTPDGRTAFVTLQGRNRVVAIDVATRTVIATMPTGTWSDGVAYSPLTR
jgi:YVTN family beta-propeller protein